MFARRATISAAIGAFALVGVACGESDDRLSREEYFRESVRIVRDMEPRASRLYYDLVVEALPRRQCAAKAGRFDGVLQAIVEAVEGMRPPAEIEALHDEFLRYARQSVAEVQRAATDAQEGTLSCGPEYNRRIYGLPSTERAQDVIATLQEMGYLPPGE
jgi:hypothetical protein